MSKIGEPHFPIDNISGVPQENSLTLPYKGNEIKDTVRLPCEC